MSSQHWSDHAFHAIHKGKHWEVCEQQPPISPVAPGVQYGQSVIEGMKAYRRADDTINVFRFDAHHARLAKSLTQLHLPAIDEALFQHAIESVIAPASQWEQPSPSDILYIRPIVYGLGGKIFPAADELNGFSVYVAAIGSHLKEECHLRLFEDVTRTSLYGLSSAKSASSYAPIIARKTAKAGFTDIWYDPTTGVIEEADTSNVFFITDEGNVITPEPDHRILHGITRASVIAIFQEELGMEVVERKITVEEVIKEVRSGKIKECFLTSTGIGIQPCHSISLDDATVSFGSNELTLKVRHTFMEIIQGNNQNFTQWNHLIPCQQWKKQDILN